MCVYVCMYIYIYIYIHTHHDDQMHAADDDALNDDDAIPTVSFHNFKSQNLKLSVSNPKSKYVAYVSVLSQI